LSLAKELWVWYTQYFASVLVSTFFSYRLSGHRYSFFSGDLNLFMSSCTWKLKAWSKTLSAAPWSTVLMTDRLRTFH
ncbi:hypothetical protein BDR07DRAFT_1435928, partial [Suillus spraguei]